MNKVKEENKILIMLAFLVYLLDYGEILDSFGCKIIILQLLILVIY